MASKIIVVCPSSNVVPIAEGMAPAGFETVVAAQGDPMIEEHLGDANYFVCYPSVDVGPQFHAKAKDLRLLQLLSAGYDAIDLDAARSRFAELRGELGDAGRDVGSDEEILEGLLRIADERSESLIGPRLRVRSRGCP